MHCHQSIWKDGSPLFYDEVGYAGCPTWAGTTWRVLKHAPSCSRSPTRRVNSYHRLVPATRRRSTWSTPSATVGLRAHPDHRLEPQGQAPGVSGCRPVGQPVPGVLRHADGRHRRIKNKIEPHEPVDKDLYELPPDEAAAIRRFPARWRPCSTRWRRTTTTCSRAACSPRTSSRPGSSTSGQRARPGTAASVAARVRDVLRRLTSGPRLTWGAVTGHSPCSGSVPPGRQHDVNGGPGGLVLVGPQMAVGVERRRGRGVPQAGLHGLDVVARGDQQRRQVCSDPGTGIRAGPHLARRPAWRAAAPRAELAAAVVAEQPLPRPAGTWADRSAPATAGWGPACARSPS